MEILGYSERGILNSLFFEIRGHSDTLHVINEFLSEISYPYRDVQLEAKDVAILIEQSFSDFGDADAVLLIDSEKGKQTIFIEAKVKTWHRHEWLIEEEYKRFKDGIEKNKVSSSNLFTQLYHKMRLFEEMRCDWECFRDSEINFPTWSSKSPRKIGGNEVVLGAVKKLSGYLDEAFYISIVPDSSSNLRIFFEDILKSSLPDEIKENDVRGWGYIAWEKVEKFCKEFNLTETLRVFEFNRGQIY